MRGPPRSALMLSRNQLADIRISQFHVLKNRRTMAAAEIGGGAMSTRRNAVAAGAALLAGVSWGFEAQAVGAQECTALASAQHFPEPTQITLTQFLAAGAATANGVPLPAHCRVQGTAQARTGVAGDLPAVPYGIADPRQGIRRGERERRPRQQHAL